MPDPTIPGFAPPRAYRTADYRRGCADMLLEMPLTVNRMCMEQADRQVVSKTTARQARPGA